MTDDEATSALADRAAVAANVGTVPPELAALDGDAPEAAPAEKLPTLAEFGDRLPLGYVAPDGKRHRDFALLPWTWDTEERLAELVEKEGDSLSTGAYMAEIVSRVLGTLGPIEVQKLRRSEKRLLVQNMYHADVMYLYIRARILAVGKNLRLEPFSCGSCKRQIKGYMGDLETIEVKGAEEIPRVTVDIPGGMDYGGKRQDKVVLGPLRWAFMETDDPSTVSNPLKIRLTTLNHSVAEFPGLPKDEHGRSAPVVLTMAHLRTASISAVNHLIDKTDQISGGPRMEVEGVCPNEKCKRPFFHDIDWRYQDFFVRSSR